MSSIISNNITNRNNIISFFFSFFFSSRRRHTRCLSDWSSDVCSSDLAKEVVLTFDDGPEPATTPRVLDALKRECVRASFFVLGRSAVAHPALVRRALRSEERRVGKECRSRWSQYR